MEFDGAFRDVLVFVNGCFIGRNNNGYAPFRFDVTDFLAYGEKNCIVARVDATFGDGWFYEGAGIYRHAWLTKTDALHLAPVESTVRYKMDGASAVLSLATIGAKRRETAENATVSWQILDSQRQDRSHGGGAGAAVSGDGYSTFSTTATLENPVAVVAG